MINFFRYWLPLYLYAGLIFYVSGISKPPVPEIEIPFLDKFLHISEYAVFGLLAARAFKNSPKEIFFKNFKIAAVLTSVLYGISDEVHQLFISERSFSVFDMLADGIGATLGVFVYSRSQ